MGNQIGEFWNTGAANLGAVSAYRSFRDYMIELLARDTDFAEALAMCQKELIEANDLNEENVEGWRIKTAMASFLRSTLCLSATEPWVIPTNDELTQMITILSPTDPKLTWSGTEDFEKRVKYRFSAAAAAVHFYKSMSHSTRLHIRKIVLHEDRVSVGNPECHVLGLVPFCLENPRLHIERRVNIWRNLFGAGFRNDAYGNSSYEFHLVGPLHPLVDLDENEKRTRYDQHCPEKISATWSLWLTEASNLFVKGMPAGSFTFTLDGDPAPDQSSDVFEIVKEDAAWQVAQHQWLIDWSVIPDFLEERIGVTYFSESFPQMISDIVEGKTFVRCSFPTGTLYDPEWILNRNRHIRPSSRYYPGTDWSLAWRRLRYNTKIKLLPPLPPLLADLALEDVIPEEESHGTQDMQSNETSPAERASPVGSPAES